MNFRFYIVLLLFALSPVATSVASMAPSQYGSTGLFSQPTATTLNAGNISFGVWGNFSSGDGFDASIIPVGLDLGLGTFMEAYGSFPNLLLNDDEPASGRGFANIGMKVRLVGKRSSAFKMALDGQMRRSLSLLPERDGLTDTVTRVIGSYSVGKFGFHGNAGYSSNEDPEDIDFKNQTLWGGGIEYLAGQRLRLIAEMEGASERISGQDGPLEGLYGFQYFISPHLTFNFAVGNGYSDASPDWRILIGLSGSQGVGTYRKPIIRLIEPLPEEIPEAQEEKVKVLKIKTLTPLIPKAAAKTSPVSKLEIPLTESAEKIVLVAAERLPVPAAAAASALAVAPVGAFSGGAGTESFGGAAAAEIVSDLAVGKPVETMVYRKFRLPEFSFDFDQHSLSEEGKKAFSEIAVQLRNEGKWFMIRIDGHTDNLGSQKYNDRLSLKRAISAATHLVNHNGFDPARIFIKGFGERNPIASNDTPEGQAQNRRLELLILQPKE